MPHLPLCTSQFQNRPLPPPGNPRAFDLRYAPYNGEFDPNEARPVGHLTFLSKRLSAVGNKRISQARKLRWRVIALVDSTWAFLLLSFYTVISWNLPLFKAWSEDKLNKKFVAAENFAELASKGKRFCFPWRVGDLTLFEVLTGGASS